MFTNFTFGKVLGTRDGSTSNGNGNGTVVNPFDLNANYGPLEYDHTKTFNLSFSYKLPKPIHNNWALGEIVNGWQLSNYTTYEDGTPYQADIAEHEHELPAVPLPRKRSDTGLLRPGWRVHRQHRDHACRFRQRLWTATPTSTLWWPATKPTVSATTSGSVPASTENGLQPLVVCDPRKGPAEEPVLQPQLLCSAASADGNVVRTDGPDDLALYPHAALLRQRPGESSRHSELPIRSALKFASRRQTG